MQITRAAAGLRLLPALVLSVSLVPCFLSLVRAQPEAMAPREAAVLVIGSGISGLAAAEKLHKHGFRNLKVLEATGRTGGRTCTQSFAKGLVEIGAQWIHGPSPENPVFQLASQFGLLGPEATLEENQIADLKGHPSDIPYIYSSSGKQISPEGFLSIRDLYSSWLEKAKNISDHSCDSDASIGSFLKEEIAQSSKEWDAASRGINLAFLKLLLNLECSISGTHSMDHVALCPFEEYTTLPGVDCTFPKGYQSLLDKIKAPLPNNTVLLNKAVKTIHWNGSFQHSDSHVYPVQVQCEDGDTFLADHVIVTVPLGFLKKNTVDFFSPPLPQSKVQAIRNLGFGTNNKILLEFEKPFWDPNCSLIHLVWEGSSPSDPLTDLAQNWIKKLAVFVVLKPPEQLGHVLCGFIAGRESEYMETLTDEEVLSNMTALLRQFTGNPNLSPPINILRTRWHSQPYTGGSYSYVAVGSSGRDIEMLAEPLPIDKDALKPLQVLFAGEATERNFYSTTHGALKSGWREAQRLISRYPTLKPILSKAKL